MIGLIGAAGRVAGAATRAGVWGVFIALLLGGALALSTPPVPLQADGRDTLTAADAPWGQAKLPDPQAQSIRSLAAAVTPSSRWKPSSSWPGPESAHPADHPSRQSADRGRAFRHEPLGAPPLPPLLRQPYDPHAPPFVAS